MYEIERLMYFLLTSCVYVDLKRYSLASDGLNKFFYNTFHNNNRRINCRTVSHNMYYLIFCDISEG
jgi:hypothetical protein